MIAYVLVACLGCGTGRYEEQLEATVKRLAEESEFAGMHPAVKIGSTKVSVQLPKFMPETALAEGHSQIYERKTCDRS